MKVLQDTWTIFHYNLRTTLRNPIFVIIGLFQPMCFLFLFAPLLTQLTQTSYFPGSNALALFIPGLLIMMGMYGSAYAGFKLIDEVRIGLVERLWVSPVSRLSLVLGRALRDMLILFVQASFLLILAYFKGLEAPLTGIALSLSLTILTGVILSSCSYILALMFKEEEALAATINFFVVPLQLLSGITLPLTLAPAWLKTVASLNPFSHTVDGARALFANNFTDTSVIISFVLMFVLATLAVRTLIKTYKSQAV